VGGVGEYYDKAVSVTGDPAPVVTLSSGTLPPGLSLSSAGRVSGTPTAAGTFAFTLSADNQVGAPATASYSLTVRPLPMVSVGAARRLEGNTGSSVLQVPVRLGRATTVPVTVSWNTVDGTARSTSDYRYAGGTLTIPAGTTSTTLPVTVYGDVTKEVDETFTVVLSRPTGARASTTVPLQTIANDD
jgi:Calx-beta domain/Putative Ig domain